MSKHKKYDYKLRAEQNEDNTWAADIIRQVSSKKTVVSKTQSGFSAEIDAQEWAEKELKVFIENLSKRNQRRSQARNDK